MLHIQDLHAYYGKSHVLQGVNFSVGQGEIVALLGRNGSGRSTTAKAIMGLMQCHGDLQFKGQSTSRRCLTRCSRPKITAGIGTRLCAAATTRS